MKAKLYIPPIVHFALVVAIMLAATKPAPASELHQKTAAAFDHYVALSETKIDASLNGHRGFLWADRLPPEQRATIFARLRSGHIVIERVETLENDKPIAIPGGLIHDWIGTVFIPGATSRRTLALVEDYNHQSEYYRPRVLASKILWHEGNDYRIYLRLYEKKVLTCVLDTQHDVHYSIIDSSRAWSRSRSTQIREVAAWGEPHEHDLPAGHDDGYLWRMNTYWRFEQKDGGMYVECRSISLTRNIPKGVGWLVGGYVESIPRESLEFTLDTTREVLTNGKKFSANEILTQRFIASERRWQKIERSQLRQSESRSRQKNIGEPVQVVGDKIACRRVEGDHVSCAANHRTERRPIPGRLCG